MIENPPKLLIKKDIPRPTDAQIAAFQNVPTSFVSDALNGRSALAGNIRPIGDGLDIECVAAGPALTAYAGAADVLASFAALGFIKGGEIIVAAFDGHTGCAAAGDRLIGMYKNCGAAAFVTDGPVRDYPGIVAVGLPVWCDGLTPASPHMSGPGTVGYPVQIGGQQVESGDMIVADRDGVVIVPFAKIPEVITKLERIKMAEAELDAEVTNGLRMPSWVGELLKSDAVKFED